MGKVGCPPVPGGVKYGYVNSRQGSQQTFSRRNQRVNSSGFEGCRICITTTRLAGHGVNQPQSSREREGTAVLRKTSKQAQRWLGPGPRFGSCDLETAARSRGGGGGPSAWTPFRLRTFLTAQGSPCCLLPPWER